MPMNDLIQGMQAGQRLAAPIAQGMQERDLRGLEAQLRAEDKAERDRQNAIVETLRQESHEQSQDLGGLEKQLREKQLEEMNADPIERAAQTGRRFATRMYKIQESLNDPYLEPGERAGLQGELVALQKQAQATEEGVRKAAEPVTIVQTMPDGSKVTRKVSPEEFDRWQAAQVQDQMPEPIRQEIEMIDEEILQNYLAIQKGDTHSGRIPGFRTEREETIRELTARKDRILAGMGKSPAGGAARPGVSSGSVANILGAGEEVDQVETSRLASPRTAPPRRVSGEEARKAELGLPTERAFRQPVSENSVMFGRDRPAAPPEPDRAAQAGELEEAVAKKESHIDWLQAPARAWMDNRIRGGIAAKVAEAEAELKALQIELELLREQS